MTNLMLWLMFGAIFILPYSVITMGTVQSPVLSSWMYEIQMLPLVLLVLFGIYAVIVVLYRTLTINDCPAAEKELLQQIKEAKKDIENRLRQVREKNKLN